ncbi:MAG TPA: hypothetical protein EYG68_12625 [Leucothrix mucor]|nr:hypothetical protein [Leucothrix mucor]
MLLIKRDHIEAVESASEATDLHWLLQSAIQLEHSTIPPYLAAAYSLKNGLNSEIKNMILDIAAEEMLHMSIVANILNAVGGSPDIANPDFIPKYPTNMPMSIGGGFEVGIQSFSHELVENVFMKIEQPNDPIEIQTRDVTAPAEIPEFATIGDFYQALIDKIIELGDDIFVGDLSRQVVVDAGFPSEQLYAITNVETAVKALEWIMLEGEGTPLKPFDSEDEPAHYYRFEEIVRGKKLIKDPDAESGYVYGGRAVRFDPDKVWEFPDNPKASDYAEGSDERKDVDAFNQVYSEILRGLHKAFNGEPAAIQESVAAMGKIRRFAKAVLSRTDPNTGKQCGLTFEYIEEE